MLGYSVAYDTGREIAIEGPGDDAPALLFVKSASPKGPQKNRIHLDLNPSDHSAEIERLLALGATAQDIGQGDAPWCVLADPEGNEFCVLRER